MTNTFAIIPARYGSTRLPGKPLTIIHGKSMIQRVYEKVKLSKNIDDTFVATDDQRIFDEVIKFGGKAIMTDYNHISGTDRCFEASSYIKKELKIENFNIINIQGDEPFIDPDLIENINISINKDSNKIHTAAKIIDNKYEIENPNNVKVVFDINNKALYFSRSMIPFQRENILEQKFYKHIGIYAYSFETLSKITSLNPSTLEKTECLEQLRWIYNDFNINVLITNYDSISVDTLDDLEKINNLKIE